MRTTFLLFSITLAVGCSTKVEIENRQSTRRETTDGMSEEAESSRINVVIEAGNDRQTASPTRSVESGSRSNPLPHQPSKTNGNGDDRLCGKWRIVEGDVDGTVQFTLGEHVLFVWYHQGLGRDWTQTGKYQWADPETIKIDESGNYGSKCTRSIEFLSEDELLITKQSGYGFTQLFGRLERFR